MDTKPASVAEAVDNEEEHIHMPSPSWSPIILALGMTLVIFGVSLASAIFLPLGAVITLIGLGSWIYDEIRNASAQSHGH
ncbi:MAG: hypothetical protein K1X39_11720 [Thermoflexales bacterium]|mgnify:CR=1 FL=1|nr:hypothetical protein [Thermoflexales bacterium]